MKYHYRDSFSQLRSSLFVLVWESKKDIASWKKFWFSQEILQDFSKKITKKQACAQKYFIWKKQCQEVLFLYTPETSYEKKVLFYGKYLSKKTEKIALYAEKKEQLKTLFETTYLSGYVFQEYKSQKKEYVLEILWDIKWKKDFADHLQTLENIILARNLWETPACDLTPEVFAKKVKKTKFQHTKVKILSYKDIQKKGLWLIEAVGKGSKNAPCMVILEHIVDKKKPCLALVGKGVTFDTGGNQIKPGDAMYDMKGDMWWAAVTYAVMKELDRHNIDKNIVACLCLAENSVSSSSYKPSDILKAYNGKTVEVIHTDAEWRLVLADGMSYLGKHYHTERLITLATLTGAVMVALGFRYAGMMGTDRKLLDALLKYSQNHTEKYIELPFDDHFIEKTQSEIADYKNLDRSVYAGSSMWAAFLSNFLENNEKYTHIDIAGAYINEGDAYGKMPKWMTGFGVESLSEIIKNF